MQALEITNLVKIYKSGTIAVKNVNLSVASGDFFALLGPNGSGKSTIIGIITSLIKKTQGDVKIFNYDIDLQSALAKTHIGLVPQEFNFNQYEKVIDILLNHAGFYGVPRSQALPKVEYYLKKLELWDKRLNPARSLSGGMKRRLMIARALIHEPKMLILDEPTVGLDLEMRRATWQFLQEINNNGRTIILTTHYLEEAEHLCNKLAIIDHGAIVLQTTMKELINSRHKHTIIVDLKNPLISINQLFFADYEVIQRDPYTLEVTYQRNKYLNELFRFLDQYEIKIKSVRNKAGKLEEVFMDLIGNKHEVYI